MSLFFRGGPRRHARATGSLQELIDTATGRRAGGLRGSPVPITWEAAQAIPAALDAIRLRHELIATLPVQVFREVDGIPKPLPVPSVLQTPAAGWSMISWLAASQKSLDMRGNAYGKIVARDPVSLLPTQIELLHPDTVFPRIDRDGFLYYRVNGKRIDPVDMWHERSHEEPGSPVGLSPIQACARSLGIDLAAEQFGADYFRDGTFPTGILSSEDDLEDEDAKSAKRQFVDSVDGRREPVVLGGNWSWQTLAIAPNESQFLETMRFGVNQVARIFNVDPELIGGGHEGSSITYANREQRALDFLAYRLNPSIRRREEALTRLTVRGQYVKLNRGGLLATDLMTRYKAYDIGLKNGTHALDEPRLLEDRQPLTAEQIAQLVDLGLLGKPTVSEPAAAGTNGAP